MNILSRTQPNYKAIVASAIARGLIRFAAEQATPEKDLEYWRAQWRARYWRNRKPSRKQYSKRPQLEGLEGKEYHRAYMRLIRGKI